MIKRIVLALALAGLIAGSVTAQTILTTTTLGAAVTSTSATTIRVASITGITANTGLWIDQEFMTVTSTPVTGTLNVTVFRGAAGTKAALHANGVLVTLGPQFAFQATDPPWGACVRAQQQYLPWINVSNGNMCSCDQLYTSYVQWRCTNSQPLIYNSTLTVT
jgi:hypothetical protein